MEHSILPRALHQALAQCDWKQLNALRDEWPDTTIATPEVVDAFLALEPVDRVLLFRSVPHAVATELLATIDSDAVDELLLDLTDHETQRLLAELSPDDRTYLLAELPGAATQRLLSLLSSDDLAEVRELLGYPEDSVGRLMTPDFASVRPQWTIGQALDHIRATGASKETVTMIYVVDDRRHLLDALPLSVIVLAKPDSSIGDLMDGLFVSIEPQADREVAARLMKRYNRPALPVVDAQSTLLGIVTIDDALEVAEEEITEDFHKSAAITPVRSSYWDSGRFVLIRNRVGWLAGLIFVSLISSGVIAAFENTLHTFVTLAFFIPLIIGTGGNAGAQSATMMIRALGIGDVKPDQWLRVFAKELVVGLALGVLVGLLGMALGSIRGGILIGLTVLCTMTTILTITNLLGAGLPFLLTKAGMDPAMASGPLITSFADAIGLLVYFLYAGLFLTL